MWDNGGMAHRLRNLWDGYRHSRSALGLLVDILGLCGVKTVVVAAASALVAGVAARTERLAPAEWFVLAIVAFAGVCICSVSLQKTFRSRHTPILVLQGGLDFLGNRAFCVPLNRCSLQGIVIRNSQVNVRNTARNVRASIDYLHDDGDRLHVESGLWQNVNPPQSASPGSLITSHLSLSGDESQSLIITAQQEGSERNVVVLTNDAANYEDLHEGHWTVTVKITADGTESLVLRGEVKVLPNMGVGLRLSYEPFAVKRPWSLRNWRS
jgi:hypothetical protein